VLVEADGVPCGIVTDRDLVVRCMADGADASERPLSQLCSEELVSLEAESAVDEAIELMKRKAVRRLPVLEDGSAIGIVSLGDLAQARDRQSVLGEVSAAPANR
jgi:signal-transduction protein with cAMP-binding, CBS, and nucleotidyltransferase domain